MIGGAVVGYQLPRGSLAAAVMGALGWTGRLLPFGRYRPFSAALSRILSILFAGVECQAALTGGGQFSFDMGDRYWVKLLMPGWFYEPELDAIFAHAGASGQKVHFIDCGANLGYWACRTAGFPNFSVSAVEPSPTVLPRLKANLSRTGNLIALWEDAIWDTAGERLSFSASSELHAGSSISSVSHHDLVVGDWHSFEVTTTTVDLIDATDRPDGTSLTILKLDVEGAETRAILGARDLIQRDNVLILFEDHHEDPASSITQLLLESGLTVMCNFDGRFRAVNNLADIALEKRQSWWIYRFCNFIAVRPDGPAYQFLEGLMLGERL